VAKSVIMRDPGDGPARYRMLDTVREFGSVKRTEDGHEDWVARRHRDWIAGIAGLPEGLGPRQVEWLDGLSADHNNVRAALEFCLATPGEARVGLRMISDLWLYWESRGHLTEGRRWADAFLLRCGDCPDRPRGLWVAGYLALVQGDIDSAAVRLEEAARLGHEVGDPTTAFAIQFLGRVRWIQGDLPGGFELTREALLSHRSARDWKGIVLTLVQLGVMQTLHGDPADANETFEECIDLCRTHGERWNLSYALWACGLAMWRQRNLAEAARLEEQALLLKRDVRDPVGVPLCVETLAWISTDAGEHERAALLLGAAAGRWRALPGELPTPLIEYRDACWDELERILGGARFESLFQIGRGLSLDEVLDMALRATASDEGAPDRRRTAPTELTPREIEVAQAIAEGLSNAAIGRRLVISTRTAETHVQHIMNKLGVSSRAQIAAWAATQGK